MKDKKSIKRWHHQFPVEMYGAGKPTGDRIVIRRWNKAQDEDQGLIALMPDAPANYGHVVAYETIGQHGEASFPDIMRITKPVKGTEQDVKDLLAELESIGYNPRPMKRIPHESLYWVKEQRKRDKAHWRGV